MIAARSKTNGTFPPLNGETYAPPVRERLVHHAAMNQTRHPGAFARHSPIDLLWHTPAIIWVLLIGQGLAIVLSLAPGIAMQRLVYFGLMSLLVQWVVLLALALLYVLRPLLARRSAHEVAWLAVVVLMASATFVVLVMQAVTPGVLVSPGEHYARALLRWVALFGVAGLFAALAFQNHWRSRQLAVKAKQAELDTLRARVNPHFLFNSLNTATSLVHARPAQAEQVLLDLSDLFRAALRSGGEHALADEVQLIRGYLEIEALRMGERLQVAWDMPEPLPEAATPTLALQSLVENAVYHGVEALPGGGCITIGTRLEDGHVVVRIGNPVSDSGSRRQAAGHGVGLAATRARLESLQPPGRLQVQAGHGEHVVEAWLPLGQR